MTPERFMDMMNMLPDDLLVSAYKNRLAQHPEKATAANGLSEQPVTKKYAEMSANHPPRWITAAALAACILFAVGVGAQLLRGQHEELMPEQSMQNDSAQSVQESSEQSMQEISEIDTEPTDTSAVPDFTLSEDGENVFGGHGMIRPMTVAAGEQYVFQDDEYYYYGGSRLLKSAVSGDDVSDQREECPQNRCDMHDLIGSGQDMYYVDLNTESAWKGHAGGLKRILSDGTVEDLHPQSKIAADDLNSIACRVTYSDVQRLGDSGIYYVNGSYKSSADEPYNDVYPDPLLLNSRTGEMRTLHLSVFFGDSFFNQYHAEYDEASGNLFVSLYGVLDETIVEIDIHTGRIVQEYPSWEHGASRGSWFVRDHVLHFLGLDPDNTYKVNWYTHDMDTGETGILLSDCHLTAFAHCDGRVYAARHTSVGDDALLSFAPDGTDEKLLGEIHDTIYGILPVFDPDNVAVGVESHVYSPFLFRQDTGFSKLW